MRVGHSSIKADGGPEAFMVSLQKLGVHAQQKFGVPFHHHTRFLGMQGYSCLMSSAFRGHAEAVELLLSKSADVNAQTDEVTTFWPLWSDVTCGHSASNAICSMTLPRVPMPAKTWLPTAKNY